MPKYSAKQSGSDQTQEEALKIARGTQKPGQTREQTKLIARGIQKGIEQYKKKHKEKMRHLDKKQKKHSNDVSSSATLLESAVEPTSVVIRFLPWALLGISWLGFATYLYIGQ